MSLRDRVNAILNRNRRSNEEIDAEHRAWIETDAGLVEIIKNPVLGIAPSERSVEQNRDLLIAKIKRNHYGR